MKLVIFDGNSVINRAFYGIRPLTNSQGLHTNGIYGFLNILLKFIDEEKPDLICAAFDLRAPTFRHEQYEHYKAQRKGMPEELAEQMPVMKELLTAMNITILEKEGFEADDIIGTVATLCKKEKIDCVIATGDKDDLQLAGSGVTVKLAATKAGKPETTTYDEEAIKEKYGVKPKQLIEVKALMGDASDNIPGVKGIGEVTALNLIAKFGSVDNIYENIDNLDIKDTIKEKLRQNKDMAFLSRKLVEICCDVPLENPITAYTLKQYNTIELIKMLKTLGFNSFITRLNLENVEVKNIATSKEITAKETDFDDISEKISKAGKLYFLFNSPTLYVNLENEIYKIDLSQGLSFSLLSVLGDNSIKKFTHDVKPFALYLKKQGADIKGVEFDTSIAGYLLNPSATSYKLDRLAHEFANIYAVNEEQFCAVLPEICESMLKLLNENGMKELFYNIELPLCFVLASMEFYGFKVDKEALTAFGEKLNTRIEEIREIIYKSAGGEFNINSPKQLGEVLFERLGLPAVKKTKTGYSTDVEVLEKLRNTHEIIDFLMEYRQLAKLKSTYVDGLLKVIAEDGRIHSSFKQTVTQTGRISSTEPNLQNIPIRHEMGRELRKMFVPQNEDFVLLDADYSQIELRVLAHIADDKEMIKAFEENVDIHTKTASEVFNMPLNMVTPLMRSRAKAVNFGIVYGIGDFSLSQDLKVTRKEARSYIDEYLETFKGVKTYMENVIIKAKEDGFVTTLSGRRRYIPELTASNGNIRKFGERIALNTPIQGTAADIIKIAMIKVYNRLNDGNFKSRLILQVHDELIVEALKSEAQAVKKILQDEMEKAMTLKAPLVAEVNEGNTWYNAK